MSSKRRRGAANVREIFRKGIRTPFQREWLATSVIVISVVWGSRLATWLAYPSGTRFPDSASYAPDSFGDWSLVSFAGNAIRPWPVPLLFSLMPGDAFRVALQLGLSAVAWTALIVSLAAGIESVRSRVVFVAIGASVSSAPASLQWDTVILAQTSHTVLVVAALWLLIRGVRRQVSGGVLAGFFAVAMLLGVTKSTHLLLVAAFGAVLVALLRVQKSGAMGQAFVVLTVAAATLVSVGVSRNVDQYWPFSYSGTTALYALGSQTPGSDGFAEYLKDHGAPDCLLATAPFRNWQSDVEEPILRDCLEAREFIRNDLSGLFVRYRVSRPVETLRVASTGFGASLMTNGLRYGGAVSFVPQPLSGLVFGTSDPDVLVFGADDQLEISSRALAGDGFWAFTPQALWILIGSIGLLVLALTSRVRAQARLAVVLLVVVISLMAESLVSLAILSSEWTRLVSPYLNPALLLSVFGVIWWWERTRSADEG
jgi:hypothetical protein